MTLKNPLPEMLTHPHASRMTTVMTHEALAYIDSAIELAEQFMAETADDHARDFAWQLRERGVMAIPLRDGFLPFEHARATLSLLRGLEKVEAQFYNALPEEKAFDPTQPLAPQMRERVATEVERQQTHLRQRLDKERQQSIGITQYRWLTEGDEKVRDSHAQKNGQIFNWGEGEMPGAAPNCRCVGAPVLESMQLPDDPPIEPVYPIEELILLVSGLGRAAKLGWEIVKRVRERLNRTDLQEISRSDLSASQKSNLSRFEQKIPINAKQTRIIRNSDNTITMQADVPARNISGSFARYEKTIDATGNTIRYIKTTFAPDGSIVHIKIK